VIGLPPSDMEFGLAMVNPRSRGRGHDLRSLSCRVHC